MKSVSGASARRAGGLLALSVLMWLLVARWRAAFLWGEAVGPYWLAIALEWAVLLLAAAAQLWLIAAVFVWLRRRGPAWTSALLLLASLVFLAAAFPALVTPTLPLDSLHALGKTYHLTRIGALTDVNYALYECRAAGLVCSQMYRSGDFPPADALPLRLTYDAAAGILAVEAPGEDALYAIRLQNRP